MEFKDHIYNFTILQVPILLPPTELRPQPSWPAPYSMAAIPRTSIGSVASLEATSITTSLSLLLSEETKPPSASRELDAISDLLKPYSKASILIDRSTANVFIEMLVRIDDRGSLTEVRDIDIVSRERGPPGHSSLSLSRVSKGVSSIKLDLLANGAGIRPFEAFNDVLDAEADHEAAHDTPRGREADVNLTRKNLSHVHNEGRVKTEGKRMKDAKTHDCSIEILSSVRCILISSQNQLIHILLCNLVRSVSNLISVTRPPQLSTKSSLDSYQSPLYVLDVK